MSTLSRPLRSLRASLYTASRLCWIQALPPASSSLCPQPVNSEDLACPSRSSLSPLPCGIWAQFAPPTCRMLPATCILANGFLSSLRRHPCRTPWQSIHRASASRIMVVGNASPQLAKHIYVNHSSQSFEDLKKCSPGFTTTLTFNDFICLSSLVHLHWYMSELTFVFVRGGRTGHIKGRYPHQGSPPPRFIQYHRSAARTAIIRVGGSPDRYERLTASTSGLSFYFTTRPIAQ